MKTAIIIIGVYLMVTAILVYQTVNPVQSDFTIINKENIKINIDSLIDASTLSDKELFKDEIRRSNRKTNIISMDQNY